MNEKEKFEVLYREYQRLNTRLDQLSDASLADFRLLSFMGPIFLGIIGVLVKVDVFGFFKGLQLASPVQLFFLVFLGLWATVAIIAFRDYLKLSLINYHVRLIWDFEKRLRQLSGENTVFRNVDTWVAEYVSNHRSIYISFVFITVIPILIIPIWILLLFTGGWLYAFLFFLIALLTIMMHLWVGAKNLKTTLAVLKN